MSASWICNGLSPPGPFTGRGLFIPAKGSLPIRVTGFSQVPDSVQAYLPVTEAEPVEFDFGAAGVRAFAFKTGGPVLTAVLDPTRIYPTCVLTALSDRGVTYRFTSADGMAIRAERGAIRKVSIAAAYARTPPGWAGSTNTIVLAGGIQPAPATVSVLTLFEGGVSSLSAVPVAPSLDTLPRIALIGENVMTITLGSAFSDPGAVVRDDSDPDKKIYAKGSVNTAAVGSYTLTYEAADHSRVAAGPVSRVVNVVGRPAPSIVSMDVVSRKVAITAGGSARKVTVLLANNTMSTVQGSVLAESSSSSVLLPELVPFSARGKSRDAAPPRVTRVTLPVSAPPGPAGETTVTPRCGELTSRFTVVFK